MDILWSGVAGAVVGGVVATYLNSYLFQKHHRLALKRDVLARLAGHRHLFGSDGKEPYIALNQTMVVFADSPAVLSALTGLHEALGTRHVNDRILSLVDAMSDASGIKPSKKLKDSFFLEPFQPQKWTRTP